MLNCEIAGAMQRVRFPFSDEASSHHPINHGTKSALYPCKGFADHAESSPTLLTKKTIFKAMGYESKLPTIFDFVKHNPMMTATQISMATGINELTVHRHLTGGRGKINEDLFIRKKVNSKRNDADRVRGTFHYLYSINPKPKPETKNLVNAKRGLTQTQLDNFIFGARP